MTDTPQTGRGPQSAGPIPLFDRAAIPEGLYSEAFLPTGEVRDHWRPIVDAMNGLEPERLDNRQERVRRRRHEDGATFNPFDDSDESGVPWALEMVPLLLTSAEWAGVEAGVIQRATLLERILADVYGPQQLLAEGKIPAEMIFANPRFLHTCHGIRPSGDRHLTFYAVDLYRAPDGRFRVLRDYGAKPSGLGYALENRIVLSRVFSELYHETQIRRLAPFFQAFHLGLAGLVDTQREDPDIVLLSPGPDSPIYFEHALLSRYLGYPLVEGQDLTVRNGQVFQKKLAGLEPIEAIFRHVGDSDIDPFASRKSTSLGVAGLIQAAREGNIEIVNPIGSGFVDTPVLPVFLPALCRELMGADPILDSHETLWCGFEPDRERILAEQSEWSIVSALNGTFNPEPGLDKASAVRNKPYAYMARRPIRPSMAPCWGIGRVEHRHTLLRVFACATENGFEVMPGGLAITAPDLDVLNENRPARLRSKDVWVLSDQPVEPFSMMSSLQMAAEFRRGSDLPSRVADHLLWLGRYLERAEGRMRLLRSLFRRLSGEAGLSDIPEITFLLTLLRENQVIRSESICVEERFRIRELMLQLNGALFNKNQPGSLASILGKIQASARNVRDRLSMDSWRVINRLENFSETTGSDNLELLDDMLFTLSAFSGLAMESMTRGLGWRFMDMGRRVERALHQANLIRAGLLCMEGEARNELEALLEVSDGIMTYRARYRTTFQLAPVLDLLLVDESNPKSLAFQFQKLSGHVDNLPRNNDRRFSTDEERLVLEMLTSLRLLDLNAMVGKGNEAAAASLTEFLDGLDTKLKEFAQRISAHYLTRIPATPHYSIILGDRMP